MADDARKTLRALIQKAPLKAQTKLSLTTRVSKWKTDRQVPEYIFRLRNLIQEKRQIRNIREFQQYLPAEEFVELRIFKEIGTGVRADGSKGNIHAFNKAYPEGVWVEQDGEYFGNSGQTDNLKNIIVPEWFMKTVPQETKTIYSTNYSVFGGHNAQGTGNFVKGVQLYGGATSFLEKLQDVCRESDEIASIELSLTRSGNQSDNMVQIVSVKAMPKQNLRAMPAHLRPLRAWGELEPRFTHPTQPNYIDKFDFETFHDMFQQPTFHKPHSCLWNAFLNTFKEKDDTIRFAKKRKTNAGRPAKLRMSYETMFDLMFPGQEFPGEDSLPPITLANIEKVLEYYRRCAKAYDPDGTLVWSYEPSSVDDRDKTQLCLLIKDDHAFHIKNQYDKGWLTRNDERSNELSSSAATSYLASYYLNENKPRQFAGAVSTLEEFLKFATANVPREPEAKKEKRPQLHIVWASTKYDLEAACLQMVRELSWEPKVKHGSNYRISHIEVVLHGTLVFLHLAPFGVIVNNSCLDEALAKEQAPGFTGPQRNPEHAKYTVSVAQLNEALVLQSELRKCLTPELRSDYAPGFKQVLTRFCRRPPTEAYEGYDRAEKFTTLDFSKFYAAIVRDAKFFPKFGLFDRFVAYDGHAIKDEYLYIVRTLKQLAIKAFTVQFPDTRNLKYGRYIKEHLDCLEVECYARPFKLVPNPFRDALKKTFNSNLPSVLKKVPTLHIIGEFGKTKNTARRNRFSRTLENAYAEQEKHGGRIKPTPGEFYTLQVDNTTELTDGFLPLQQYVYDEAKFRLAQLITEVGEENVLAVNTDCVYLRPGTKHNFTEVYDTNCYENLGKVMEEACPKSIRGKVYEVKHQEPVELISVRKPTIHRRVGYERFSGVFDPVLDLPLVLNKSPIPGAGKSALLNNSNPAFPLGYIQRKCKDQRVAIVCPTNFQARQQGPTGITLYELCGKVLGREHLRGKPTAEWDVVILEEIGQWSYTHWLMFLEFKRNNPNTRFLANGDTKQIPPIEKNWNGTEESKMDYYDRVMDEVFPDQIELLEVKRFKAAKVKLVRQMFYDFWVVKLPLPDLVNKYAKLGARKNAVFVAYRLDVVDWVNTQLHGKKAEYYEGLTLVKASCEGEREYKGKEALKRGYEVQVSRIDGERVWLHDAHTNLEHGGENGFTRAYVRKNFDYAYAFTGHKLQGRSFDEPVVVLDTDFHYASRNWLWVAFTRTRDPQKIYYFQSPEEDVLTDHFILKKLRNYERSDRDKDLECDLLAGGDTAALAWFREALNAAKSRCYGPFNDCDKLLTFGSKGKKFRSDLTLDRVNNEYGHMRHQVRFCCEHCNERKKDANMLE